MSSALSYAAARWQPAPRDACRAGVLRDVCDYGGRCVLLNRQSCVERGREDTQWFAFGAQLGGNLHMAFGCFTHQCIASSRNHLFGV